LSRARCRNGSDPVRIVETVNGGPDWRIRDGILTPVRIIKRCQRSVFRSLDQRFVTEYLDSVGEAGPKPSLRCPVDV
jgi:hypothetical protein